MQNVVASKLFVSTLESYYDNYLTTTVADLDSDVTESCLSGDGRLLVVSDSDITRPAGILVPSAGALATAGSLGMVGSVGFAAAITGDIVLAGDDLDSIPPPPPLLAAESSSSVVTRDFTSGFYTQNSIVCIFSRYNHLDALFMALLTSLMLTFKFLKLLPH